MRLKKSVCFITCLLLLLLSACSPQTENKENIESTQPSEAADQLSFKGVWLSCYELNSMLSVGSEEAYRANVISMLECCKEKSINAVFLQVRPFADSVYPSEIFPLSEYICSSAGKAVDFDVLKIFIELAHAADIEVHAWINPYRISYKTDISQLDGSSIAMRDEYSAGVVCTDAGIYLDPSVIKNQSLVLSGVREIIDNYDVDGIHIDDYFYPLTDDEFDKTNYESYREMGGTLSLAEWRRENVNSLVSSLYSLVHSYSDELVFSISPAGDIEKNYSSYYADVELWLKADGYADMIVPQLYYGFEHEKMPFEKIAKKWESLERSESVKLVCGLAPYKQGTEDELAGSGSMEWTENTDVIERQIEYLCNSDYYGYALFSYEAL